MKNLTDIFLGLFLIALTWTAVLLVAIALAFIFEGGELILRTILTTPFSFGAIYATRSIILKYFI